MCSQDLHQLIQSSPAGLASHDPWDSQIHYTQISWLKQKQKNTHVFQVKSNINLSAIHNTFLQISYFWLNSNISPWHIHMQVSKAFELIA